MLEGLASLTTHAQISTSITSTPGTYAQGNLNTQVADPRVDGINMIHDITGGTRPSDGANLFHSFDQLSVGVQHIANFLNDTGLPTENILSRVTGGDPSKIFGTIQTTGFPDTNLFLLNPAGVVFGPNAKLDVKGAFYASTADFVQLSQNGIFYASLKENSVLTAAAPEAFGFLGADPPTLASTNSASIFVEGLEVKNGRSVSLVSRDAMAGEEIVDGIAVNGGTLQSPNGRVTMVSIGASQVPELTQISVGLESLSARGMNERGAVISEPVQLGGLTLKAGAHLDTSGDGGGAVVIRGGKLLVEESRISANVNGSINKNSSALVGNGIDIVITDDVTITNSAILETNVLRDAAQGIGSGGIRVKADQVRILNQASIDSSVLAESTGGPSGNIEVEATSVFTENANSNIGAIQAGTSSTADGGIISLKVTDSLEVQEGSFLWTFTDGTGHAGDIRIEAGKVLLSSPSPNFTGITSQTFQSGPSQFTLGNAGNISIKTNQLELLDGASTQISSATFASGDSGNIEIDAQGGNVLLSGVSMGGILTNAARGSTGQAGRINLRAGNLELTNQASFQAVTTGSGNAGDVTVSLTGDLDLKQGSFIQVRSLSAENSAGNAGNLTITAKDVAITGDATRFSGFTADTNGGGQGGDVSVLAQNLHLDRSSITAQANGTGDAGAINITAIAGGLFMEGSSITTKSSLTESRAGDAGNVTLEGMNNILIENSSVTTQAENALGGNIKITADNLIQINNSEITSRVQEGSTNAGSINIDPQFITVQNSLIDTSANFGDGGDVTFVADSAILIDPFSTIDTSSQFGGSGTVNIRAPIQNLSESIAPLPEALIKIGALFAARCAAQKGGTFSSFTNESGLTPTPSSFLPSPLTFSTSGPEGTTTTVSPLGFDKIIHETEWKFFTTAKTLDLPQGCSSAPAFPS